MLSRWFTAATLLTLLSTSHAVYANAEFEAWKQQQETSFNNYLSAEQAAFKKALESDWENFKLAQPQSIYSEPKVDKPPVAPEPSKQIVDVSPEIKEKPLPEVKPPEPEKPPVKTPEKNTLAVYYLGQTFHLPNFSISYSPLKAENKAIANAWESLYPALTDTVEKLQSDAQVKALPDWALISLLDAYSAQVSNGDENGQQLLFWSLLMEMGYDARLAYDNQYLYLLLPSQQKIYGKAAIDIKGTKYYLLTGREPKGSLYTHTSSLNNQKTFNFSFSDKQPIQGLKAEQRVLRDDITGLELHYYVYPELASYYRHHPPIDLVWYFKVTPQDQNYQEMVNALKAALAELPKSTQVRVLLSLIQQGYEYEKDQQQWGEEYYATPMHTLMLEAADCEDRSFLFAYLVEQVVGIPTVGLKYPGHLAVAVALPDKDISPNAEYVLVAGQKYYVADPTYIGADIGQAMPMFDGIKPEVVNKH